MTKVSVIGAGSWGMALAVLLIKNKCEVTVWSYRQDQIEELKKTGKSDKLPEITFPKELLFTADIKEACNSADVILMAVPSKATRNTAEKIQAYIKPSQIIVTVTKGIEESTLKTQSQILTEVLGDEDRICVLSGPSHAEEVVSLKPTVVVAGSTSKDTAEYVQNLFMNKYFRVYTSPDVVGIEVGAALKNVIALAAGMSDGLGFGDNAKAALITRGIKEISALAVAMGGSPETLAGLTGVGDLIVTCSSVHSRNRMAGYYMGQGMSADDAMKKVAMVVEGVHSAKAALKLANKYQIEMPIVEQVNDVIFNNKSAIDVVYGLMTREKKSELNVEEWN
ncbi:MAG: NAD(P)H-dependent glycerol-3-phosphate dehydrogenase [Pseudobutyrivibrio sp.]|nr:NAD(P)H-dependent glycerol-3-phosphate dehydrogenase [Pseudobutyrivibrio sp.]